MKNYIKGLMVTILITVIVMVGNVNAQKEIVYFSDLFSLESILNYVNSIEGTTLVSDVGTGSQNTTNTSSQNGLKPDSSKTEVVENRKEVKKTKNGTVTTTYKTTVTTNNYYNYKPSNNNTNTNKPNSSNTTVANYGNTTTTTTTNNVTVANYGNNEQPKRTSTVTVVEPSNNNSGSNATVVVSNNNTNTNTNTNTNNNNSNNNNSNTNNTKPTTPTDPMITTIKNKNDKLGSYGRLYINNFSVALNYANAVSGGNAQSIVDASDSAAYFTLGNNYVIGDHNYQGFNILLSISAGQKAYIKKTDGSVITYQLLRKYYGKNVKTDLVTDSGLSVKAMNEDLIMYTCTDTGVIITIWDKI